MNNIFVQHRINTIKELSTVSEDYGVEVDIRAQDGNLICAHDPSDKGELLKNFLSSYNHAFFIANIKDEGIEQDVIRIFEDYKIENYFLLDVSFPFIIKLSKLGIKKIALRVSDLELFNPNILDCCSIEWIWLDAFDRFPVEELKKIEEYSQSKNIKICLVSPELHMSRSNLKSERIHDQIRTANYSFDAICTKNITLWQK